MTEKQLVCVAAFLAFIHYDAFAAMALMNALVWRASRLGPTQLLSREYVVNVYTTFGCLAFVYARPALCHSMALIMLAELHTKIFV